MPEGVHGYPRWDGQIRTGPTLGIIAEEEIRRTARNWWAQLTFMVLIGVTIVFLGQVYQASESQGDLAHNMGNFTTLLFFLPWFTLAAASIMASPALLEDQRHGALELYLSRPVTKSDYLAGKIAAVLGVTFATIWLPVMLYWGATLVFFEEHPDAWMLVPVASILYALMWALMVSGLGLGLSCVARSTRAATLVLFGGVAVAEAILANLLNVITRKEAFQILSPFSAMEQQTSWLYSMPDLPFAFPVWWGLLEWAALTIVGWGLVAWRHPRLRGE